MVFHVKQIRFSMIRACHKNETSMLRNSVVAVLWLNSRIVFSNQKGEIYAEKR